MNRTVRTWLWIVVGFFGLCVLGLVLVAGAGFYFVSHHIAMQRTSSSSALQALDEARSAFKTLDPLIEVDSLDQPHAVRAIDRLPTSPVKPQNLHILAWNPDDGRLARISLPLWILRMGRRKMDLLHDTQNFDFERLNLDVAELERIGPALILDYRAPRGERVLIWTQ
jgi:hypothetical protein